MKTKTTTKLVRVIYWAGTTQLTDCVSTYRAAMRLIERYHRNAYSPKFIEISSGRELHDDGNGLIDLDRSVYVV